ncbi:MAG TPA: mannonate dehydratase, partial [Bacteroidales bacterium]|nr:mannonate dehydratase [Bacteroidales bacterium]
MSMEQTWRWYGPKDPVSLSDIRQAGATGIVTALHDIPIGEVWPLEDILSRKDEIILDRSKNPPAERGLTWSVIESVPVHEEIKTAGEKRDEFIEKYKETLRNVGKAGIKTVCYNFMPVVDWTRTNLQFKLEDGAYALAFDMSDFIAFDLFILEREGAEGDYTKEQIEKANKAYENMSDEQRYILRKNIIAGLPGAQEGYSLESFKQKLNDYKDITPDIYRENLAYFLKEVIPVAEEAGVRLAVHPDDPPYPLFGLPRVVSSEADFNFLLGVRDSVSNGITFCTGSLAVNPDNDLVGMVQRLGAKINFAHLRSTQRDLDGSFHEASHLQGDVDMYNVILSIL